MSDMQRDPHVDRWLGELWLISDILTADLRGDFAAAREKVGRWEPRPMPAGWPLTAYQSRSGLL